VRLRVDERRQRTHRDSSQGEREVAMVRRGSETGGDPPWRSQVLQSMILSFLNRHALP
jgi:hypothetical protein